MFAKNFIWHIYKTLNFPTIDISYHLHNSFSLAHYMYINVLYSW